MATAKKKRKPTQKDWEKMQTLFLKGEKPRFIVEKFPELDITAKQVSTKFCKKNLGEKKKKIEEKATEKIIDKLADIKARTNEAHIQAYELLQQKVLEKIRQDTYQVVIGGKFPEIVDIENDLSQLAKGAVALEKIQKGQRLALNLDNQDESEDEPEMVFVENVDLDKI